MKLKISVTITNSKTILFIKRFDKSVCASNHGNVDDCLVRSYNSTTNDDDIIDELSIILCSLFNEFLFSFGRYNHV
ncbi:unnamed protein product [Rotaria sp. Silwood2]|nr:unnamed protein product [Rotaria sp. Silwood2]CAF3350971.1 unnamed protein product [Rotaria sp. Silwood2]CAF4523275.1 unnamed protein product [Rotaria sp. Silwood2]CAF4764452.1 unnamed protein product [Rotaria sp. Silwood2]